MLTALLALLLTSGSTGGAGPRAVVDESVQPDLAELVEESWALFFRRFAGRADCFGDVTVRAVTEQREVAIISWVVQRPKCRVEKGM